jgi:deoxyribodipyrimidine photolyase-like uncharacterized protein
MRCVARAVEQTRDEAYAHHIQRLMVTGNFALLAGIDPHAVHEWYLAVYADAYEWVEAPNVIGMSQFADGGIVGSKPYVSGGNYIRKMSDYCKGAPMTLGRRLGIDRVRSTISTGRSCIATGTGSARTPAWRRCIARGCACLMSAATTC